MKTLEELLILNCEREPYGKVSIMRSIAVPTKWFANSERLFSMAHDTPREALFELFAKAQKLDFIEESTP